MQPHYELKKNVIEGELCHFWLENDLLHIVANDRIITEQSLEHDFNLIVSVTNHRQVKLFYDATKIQPIEKKIRLLLESMLNQLAVGLAVRSESRIGAMVANIFFTLSTTKVPKRIFLREEEAKNWLNGLR